jgi:hypothetical protein
VALAHRLDLAHRIAARNRLSDLRAEVGLRPAGRLFARLETIRRRALALASEATGMAEVAHGIPLVALKVLALRLEGTAPDGMRRAGDVDFLVAETDVDLAVARLADVGYRNPGFPVHHAVHLEDESGHAVDLHHCLPGVRLGPGRQSARLSDLEAGALLVSAPGSSVRWPRREVLAAHLIVHGLVQHGLSFRGYPLLRMVADLADLGLGPRDPATERGYQLIRDEVTEDEMRALVTLVDRLRDGEEGLLERSRASGGAEILLRHFVACAIDVEYGNSLRLRAAFRQGPEAPPSVWAVVGRALFVSDAQIDLIYGRPRGGYGYLGWRLFRPIDLAVRTVRYAWAAVRRSCRQQSGQSSRTTHP